jgi:transposase
MSQTYIGIDVCKDHLDAYARPSGDTQQFANDEAGIAALVAWARKHQPERILFESTGHYCREAVTALLLESLPAVVVNARQARDFAKGLGHLAKTDAIDARDLAHFGEVVPTKVRPLESQEIQELRGLLDRRVQLVGMIAADKNRRQATKQPAVLRSIDRCLAYLKRQVADLEKRMDKLVEASATFKAKDEILQSVPGIGPHVSRTLLAHLPELGTQTRQKITSLVGLAPYNDDSGLHKGARHIRGGRGKVRIGLYQAAVSSVRHNPAMKAFYVHLRARGKAAKVALIAVARKLLVLANALLREMKPCDDRANSICPKNA